MRSLRLIALAAAALSVGCTTNATRLVQENYRLSESQKQLAMDNVTKVAKDQMLLNLAQRLRALGAKEDVIQAVQKTWVARNQLEEMRVQFVFARTLTMVTVGPYLYDQIGFGNALMEDASQSLQKFSTALNAGDQAAGVSTPTELLPAGAVPSSADMLKLIQKKPTQ